MGRPGLTEVGSQAGGIGQGPLRAGPFQEQAIGAGVPAVMEHRDAAAEAAQRLQQTFDTRVG